MKSAGDKETEKRLSAILEGAFKGPPTPLKDIPKRDGQKRSSSSARPSKRAK